MDVDSLKDPEKHVGNLEDSFGTSHSHESSKEGKEGKIR